MIHVAGPTDLFWTVSVGMGFAVLAVVIVLLNLLLKSVRALDTRVDHVWSAAAGVHAHTATAGPQLRAAERQLQSAVVALRSSAPQLRPSAPRFPKPPAPQFRPADPRFPTSLPPVPEQGPDTPGRRW